MASLYLHGLLLTALALASFAATESKQVVLQLRLAGWEAPSPEMTEIEFSPVQMDDFVEPMLTSLTDAAVHSIVDLQPMAPVGAAAPSLELGTSDLESLAQLLDGSHAIASSSVSELGEAATAKFFGAAIEGRRIVFVLDNSGSMQGGRLETVIAELQRCVESLESNQHFYVIFHSDALYPLFYPEPADRFVLPTPENKRRLEHWLATVELCLGDSVDAAVAAAESIRPDVMYLLSDGKIPSQRKRDYLQNSRLRHFPIHTFGVGMSGNSAGRQALRGIAEANYGEFRHTEIPPAMRQLSRQTPRTYHRDRPGAIWGRNVVAR